MYKCVYRYTPLSYIFRHARFHPRTRGGRGGDEAGERISANYLNQSKIAYVRCIQIWQTTIAAKITIFRVPRRRRIDFADFGESEGPVGKNGTLKKSQEDKTLKVISLIVFN